MGVHLTAAKLPNCIKRGYHAIEARRTTSGPSVWRVRPRPAQDAWLSQDDLASMIGTNRRFISGLERGKGTSYLGPGPGVRRSPGYQHFHSLRKAPNDAILFAPEGVARGYLFLRDTGPPLGNRFRGHSKGWRCSKDVLSSKKGLAVVHQWPP